jgi:hypothetical protein
MSLCIAFVTMADTDDGMKVFQTFQGVTLGGCAAFTFIAVKVGVASFWGSTPLAVTAALLAFVSFDGYTGAQCAAEIHKSGVEKQAALEAGMAKTYFWHLVIRR